MIQNSVMISQIIKEFVPVKSFHTRNHKRIVLIHSYHTNSSSVSGDIFLISLLPQRLYYKHPNIIRNFEYLKGPTVSLILDNFIPFIRIHSPQKPRAFPHHYSLALQESYRS